MGKKRKKGLDVEEYIAHCIQFIYNDIGYRIQGKNNVLFYIKKERGDQMKKIIKNASIGVEETNDMLIEVEPADAGSGVILDFKTSVPYQYGDHLYYLILKTIEEAGYTDLKMVVRDKGSWDYTVKARVLTVLERGSC